MIDTEISLQLTASTDLHCKAMVRQKGEIVNTVAALLHLTFPL